MRGPLTLSSSTEPSFSAAIAEASAKLAEVRGEVAHVIFGQNDVIDQALTALVANGHILLVGLPGLAKTRLVTALARALGLDAKRIQCTPDLMPSDMIGAEILEEVDYGRRSFRFVQGPVFCQLLMVDEINRASPRSQSALLQAMEEKHITLAGREHALPEPFLLLATQNPIEQEGTYALPEAQLDRFLMQIDIGYPSREAEKRIMENTSGDIERDVRAVLYAKDLLTYQKLVQGMPLPPQALDSILSLVRAARPETSPLDIVKRYVAWGPSPRASRALGLLARSRALVQNKPQPTYADIAALVRPTLKHRIALNTAARIDGVTI